MVRSFGARWETSRATSRFVLPRALGLFPDSNIKVQLHLLHLGFKAKSAHRLRLAAVIGWMLGYLFRGVLARAFELSLCAAVAADRGQTAKAVSAADAMLNATAKILPTTCLWFMVNMAIDVYVNAGCYGKALGAADRWTSSAQDLGRASEPISHALVQINRAEALHNLGRQSEALALLDEAEPAAHASPLAKHGRDMQRTIALLEQARGHRYKRQSGPVLALLGEAYEATGRIEDARSAYAGALSLDPESTAAEKARARLDFLNRVPIPG